MTLIVYPHNKNKAHCMVCGRVLQAGEGYVRKVRGCGSNPRVFCDRDIDNACHYHESASIRREKIGTEKKSSLARTTVGIEWETENKSLNYEAYQSMRGALERAGFVAERDGSLEDGFEFPSPICEGVKSLSALIHSMANRGEDVFLKGENTGMHIHARADKMNVYVNWYHTLFIPFCEWIDSHDIDFCNANFGGRFRSYAHKINRQSNVYEHSNFVNMQHAHTIEWRIPRYVSACQTVILLKFWRKVLWMLNNTDWKEDADYATRKAVAVQASKNIVKIASDTFEHGLIDKLNRETI